MATTKPYNKSIDTPLKAGYKFLRSVYKGKPSIYAAQDINRHFEQIQAIQESQGENVGPILLNVKTNIYEPQAPPKFEAKDSNLPIQVFYGNALFSFDSGAYVPLNQKVYIVATKKVVTFNEDADLSGIEVATVPYQSSSSDTLVYVDERFVVTSDVNTVTLAENEVVVCEIMYNSTDSPYLLDDSTLSDVSVSSLGRIHAVGYNDEEAKELLSSNHKGSIFDYFNIIKRYTYNMFGRVRIEIDSIDSALSSRISANVSSLSSVIDLINGSSSLIAFRSLPNIFTRYNVEKVSYDKAQYKVIDGYSILEISENCSNVIYLDGSYLVNPIDLNNNLGELSYIKHSTPNEIVDGLEMTIFFKDSRRIMFNPPTPSVELSAVTGYIVDFNRKAGSTEFRGLTLPNNGFIKVKFIEALSRWIVIDHNGEKEIEIIRSTTYANSGSGSLGFIFNDLTISAPCLNSLRKVKLTIFCAIQCETNDDDSATIELKIDTGAATTPLVSDVGIFGLLTDAIENNNFCTTSLQNILILEEETSDIRVVGTVTTSSGSVTVRESQITITKEYLD